MIRVTDRISIVEDEITETFIRASGPGGQNVNKVSTAVELRFDVRASPNLPDDVRVRLARLAGRRLTQDGVLVLTCQLHRTQDRNRTEVLQALIALIQQAAQRPTPRRKTRPSLGEKRRRVEAKVHRGKLKRDRSGPAPE